MDGNLSVLSIDQKMAEMRIKNLELLKRHLEIEEDRQLAEQSEETIESIEQPKKSVTTMRSSTRNRLKTINNHQHSQENNEGNYRLGVTRRKGEDDRSDVQLQRTQKKDSSRLKRDRVQESNLSPQQNTTNPELLEYAYPFHHRTDNRQVNRIGSGRFNHQQRAQEQGQRRREERMRRGGTQTNGHLGENTEFHLDIPPIPLWQNGSLPAAPPHHVQLLPAMINGHHAGADHLVNTANEQMEASNFLPNYLYSSPIQSASFNSNGTVYFTQVPPLMATAPSSSQGPSIPNQPSFHQYLLAQTFENSNRQQCPPPHPPPIHYPSSSIFQLPPPSAGPQLSTYSSTPLTYLHTQSEEVPPDLPPRFRSLKGHDYENRFAQARPMSGDFDRFHPNTYTPSNVNLRLNADHRSKTRPQSFYDFSSHSQSNNINNNNHHFSRSSMNNRFQRNHNNTNLPLSAYMNTDDTSYRNENYNHHWNHSHHRRRNTNQQRNQQQDKHQFPLSLYDPRQYGFATNNSKRNENNSRINNDQHNSGSNDIDLIEEWWEDNNPDSTGNDELTEKTDSQLNKPTINDSGNSSLSTSMNLKESTLDDEDQNLSITEPLSPPSTDSNIIESLDKLQHELKLEEAMEKQLSTNDDHSSDIIEKDLLLVSSNKEPTTYETAHFMQWAKDKFREELAGRLTAQEIEQHDAVTTDDDDIDEDDLILAIGLNKKKLNVDQLTDDDNDNSLENLDELKDHLQNNLIIDDNLSNANQSIVVE